MKDDDIDYSVFDDPEEAEDRMNDGVGGWILLIIPVFLVIAFVITRF